MILYAVFAVLLDLASARYFENNDNRHAVLGDLPMQNPDLFGGDMLGVELDTDRTAIRGQNFRWMNRWGEKVIPYKIVSVLAPYKDLIESAMEEYHNKTCIRFIPFEQDRFKRNYIHIFPGNGCYSHVGMIGGGQEVSLGEGCMYKGIILHELGHAVGFYHEHMRSDRDDYITIHWENIRDGLQAQFAKVQTWKEILFTPFDYTSIMIYDNKAFSKDGKSHTMDAKTGVPLVRPALKSSLSADDVIRINKMYDCKM